MVSYCRVTATGGATAMHGPTEFYGSKTVTFAHTIRAVFISGALASTALVAAPVAAQDNSDARIKKLEAEVRALQRKVFPGGSGKYFEPEITTATGTTTPAIATPSSTAVTDMLSRIDAIEAQMQRLTAQVEENGNSLRELSSRLAALEVTSGAAMSAGELPASGTVPLPASSQAASPPSTGASGTPTPGPAPVLPALVEKSVTSKPTPTPAAASAPVGPTAERLAAVQAIAKPQTDDAGDDEYSYGFRLWNAGFYPEAQQQLALFLEKYPSHSRTTYGRNLLGRAYLDDGKPREAAGWFLKNYQMDKQSARAPDSLLYLAESMIAMKDTNRACIALAEFGETYPALASGRLRDQYEGNRQKVKCN